MKITVIEKKSKFTPPSLRVGACQVALYEFFQKNKKKKGVSGHSWFLEISPEKRPSVRNSRPEKSHTLVFQTGRDSL